MVVKGERREAAIIARVNLECNVSTRRYRAARGSMSATKRRLLAVGTAVRHAYDGARGSIEAIDRDLRCALWRRG